MNTPRAHSSGAYYLRLQQERRCMDCKQVRADVTGRWPRCPPCRTTFNQARQDRYQALKRRGLCPACGLRPPAAEALRRKDGRLRLRALCDPCNAPMRRYTAKRKGRTDDAAA